MKRGKAVFKFACHKCGMLGHRRSQCKNPKVPGEKFNHFARQPAVKEASKEASVEVLVEKKTEVVMCKWCCETSHASKLCRRYKTRLCLFEDCRDEDCPYAHSASELRDTIWFHTELCTYATHTLECRRVFAHCEEEKYNALSALVATRMSADLLS